ATSASSTTRWAASIRKRWRSARIDYPVPGLAPGEPSPVRGRVPRLITRPLTGLGSPNQRYHDEIVRTPQSLNLEMRRQCLQKVRQRFLAPAEDERLAVL